jgi:hypothetical protein
MRCEGMTFVKWILILWALPLALLGAWYGLSYYDINFGWLILSRQMHDIVFEIYGRILGVPAEDVPPMVLKAIVVDTLILFGILAFRRRRAIAAAWTRWRGAQSPRKESESLRIEDSLSSAP